MFETLSPLAEPTIVGTWNYQFLLPARCSRILAVTFQGADEPYELQGRTINCDRETVDLRYVYDFADTDDGFAFPADFAETLANLLGADLAMSITQTQSLQDTLLNRYQERLRQARFNGAIEQPVSSVVASSWLDAHDGSAIEIDPRIRGLTGY